MILILLKCINPQENNHGMQQKLRCLHSCPFFILPLVLVGLFSILNTGFIKGDELVFVSGDKRETGERKAT